MLQNRSQQFLKQNTKACNEIANEYFFSLLQNRGLKVYSIKFNWKKKVDLLQYFCSFASISVWAFESRSFFKVFFSLVAVINSCTLYVLRGQPIKLIHVATSSELHESWCVEWPFFLQNHSLSFLQCLSSLKNWLLQKLSMKGLEKNF